MEVYIVLREIETFEGYTSEIIAVFDSKDAAVEFAGQQKGTGSHISYEVEGWRVKSGS